MISTSLHTSVLPHIACACSPSQEKNERLICLALQSASSYCQRRLQSLEPQVRFTANDRSVRDRSQSPPLPSSTMAFTISTGIKTRLLAWANYVRTAIPIVSTSNKRCKNTRLELSGTCKIPHPVPPSERRDLLGKTARESMHINCSAPSSTPLSSKSGSGVKRTQVFEI